MSIYDSSTIGTAGNLIRFNDDTGTPYYRMRSRTPSRRELREFEAVLPEGSGINDTTSYIGKMYMVLEGTMYPDDENGFHEGREALRRLASLEVSQDDANSDNGYVLYKWDENVGKQLPVKVLYADMSENTRFGIKQPFRLLCKIKYPAIQSQQVKTQALGIRTVSQLGGLQIPAAVSMSIPSTTGGTTYFPMTFPVVIGGTTSEGQTAVTNDGDLDTWPTIVIYGPVSKPKITNVTSGEFMELDINLASSSDSAIIAYDQDSLSVVASGVNVYGKLTTGSSLFKIKPGSNDLTFTGATLGVGSQAIINWRDSWPLS